MTKKNVELRRQDDERQSSWYWIVWNKLNFLPFSSLEKKTKKTGVPRKAELPKGQIIQKAKFPKGFYFLLLRSSHTFFNKVVWCVTLEK